MTIDRRQLLAATAAAGLTAVAGPSIAQNLRKVRFGFGFKAINPIVINVLIGERLGYNRAEGFTMEPLPLGTNANVQIAIDKGDCEFGVGTPSFQLPLYARGELPPIVNFYEYTYPYKWDVTVRPDSPIQSYEDLRGKKIGVSTLGTTDYPVTRAVLKNLGIDPDTGVSWVAVGEGVTAGVALQRGAIDALAYFDTGFGQIEGAGIAMRFLPRPKEVPLIGGLFISAKADFLKGDRTLAIGMARAVAKSSEFILAKPAAGAKALIELFPEIAPRGASLADGIRAILPSVQRRMTLYKPPYPDTKMGFISGEELLRDAAFLGLKVTDVAPLFTNDLIEEINSFDRKPIIAQAEAYTN